MIQEVILGFKPITIIIHKLIYLFWAHLTNLNQIYKFIFKLCHRKKPQFTQSWASSFFSPSIQPAIKWIIYNLRTGQDFTKSKS